MIEIVLFVVATSTKLTSAAILSSAPTLDFIPLASLFSNQSIPPKYCMIATRPPTKIAITAMSCILVIPSCTTVNDFTNEKSPWITPMIIPEITEIVMAITACIPARDNAIIKM